MPHDSAAPRPRSTALWTLIIIVLIAPALLPLWVPLPTTTGPTLWGVPFLQLLLVPVSAVLTLVAFAVAELADRRNRRRGGA